MFKRLTSINQAEIIFAVQVADHRSNRGFQFTVTQVAQIAACFPCSYTGEHVPENPWAVMNQDFSHLVYQNSTTADTFAAL
jgi:hypothetical protein